jgi:alpha-beta hydrolase superfamily lysophospholipase
MTPPGAVTFDAVEFGLGHGVSCFGEYAIAAAPPGSLCVVLHDEGEDLVSLRWLSVVLLAEGISQLLIDLPGHGLSEGSMSEHLVATLDAARAFGRSVGASTLCFVAKGAACRWLLRTDQACAPVAAVLVSPAGLARETMTQHLSWQQVPKLAFLPFNDPLSAASADAVIRDTHAWCLRAGLAFDPDDPLVPAEAQTQIGSIAAKFLLEHIAFAQAAQPSRPEPGGLPVSLAPGGPEQP